MTNLPLRPAPVLARIVSTLSALTGGRVVLGLGAGGSADHAAAFGSGPHAHPGAGGPRALAITGRLADGWIPQYGADWRSPVVRRARAAIDAAACRAGRDLRRIFTCYNITAALTSRDLARTRDGDGVGSAAQPASGSTNSLPP